VFHSGPVVGPKRPINHWSDVGPNTSYWASGSSAARVSSPAISRSLGSVSTGTPTVGNARNQNVGGGSVIDIVGQRPLAAWRSPACRHPPVHLAFRPLAVGPAGSVKAEQVPPDRTDSTPDRVPPRHWPGGGGGLGAGNAGTAAGPVALRGGRSALPGSRGAGTKKIWMLAPLAINRRRTTLQMWWHRCSGRERYDAVSKAC
jgi:hypothetical protein